MRTSLDKLQRKVNYKLLILCTAFFTVLIVTRLLVGYRFIWDEAWYASIIEQGYSYILGNQSSVAFFPLFPILVKIISIDGLIPVRAMSLTLNLAAIYGTCYYALALAQKLHPGKYARLHKLLIVLGILTFPASFFYVNFYADALLVFFVTSAVYYAFDKNYILAFALAGLASATKFTGIAAVLTCLFIVAVQEKKYNLLKFAGYAALGASGLILYMMYLGANFKNPLSYIQAQQAWGRNSSFFAISLVNELRTVVDDLQNSTVSKSFEFARILNVVVAAGALILGVLDRLCAMHLFRYRHYWHILCL